MRIRPTLLSLAGACALLALAPAGASDKAVLTPEESVGRRIFFDKSLSEPAGQSCASCHQMDAAFSDPRGTPTSHGVDRTLFGPRNAPSLKYAAFAPKFQSSLAEGSYFGGQFRDGRVDTLEEQARQPFLNPVEMANPDSDTVVAKVAAAPYADQFKAVFGADIFSHPDKAFGAIAAALAAFERTRLFAPFDSKYDAWQQGRATLTDSEARGMAAFNDPARGNCASCHLSVSPTHAGGLHPLFTDFGYDNAGVPRNPSNRFYSDPPQFNPDGRAYVDLGLEGHVLDPHARGQFKAPSLRNVAVTGPYMHNGYFRTLRGVVDFYNTRDAKPACADVFTSEADAEAQGCWPAPEMPETINVRDMGNLHLSEQDVDDIVAFMGTLTDGWTPDGNGR
jgi:cytochrome c peroxidase